MRNFIVKFTILLFVLGNPINVIAQENIPDYDYTTKGTRTLKTADGNFLIKILLEESNFGGAEAQIAELTFPSGYQGQEHPHDAIEIFYVLEGHFGHEINGVKAILKPGEVGIVRVGDTVIHSVHSETPAKVLTIWLPGTGAPKFNGLLEEKISPKK